MTSRPTWRGPGARERAVGEGARVPRGARWDRHESLRPRARRARTPDRGPGVGARTRLVERLVPAAQTDDHGAFWSPTDETGIGARGERRDRDDGARDPGAPPRRPPWALAARALERLGAWRGADGRFGTTQSTILRSRRSSPPRRAVDARGPRRDDHGCGQDAHGGPPRRLDRARAPRPRARATIRSRSRRGRRSDARGPDAHDVGPVVGAASVEGTPRPRRAIPGDVLTPGRRAPRRSRSATCIRRTWRRSSRSRSASRPAATSTRRRARRGSGARGARRDGDRDLSARSPRGRGPHVRAPFPPRYALDVQTAPSRPTSTTCPRSSSNWYLSASARGDERAVRPRGDAPAPGGPALSSPSVRTAGSSPSCRTFN